MTTFAIGVLQLAARNGNNVDNMVEEIEDAVRRFPWLDLLLLPELNAFGASVTEAVAMPGPVEEEFAALAAAHRKWLIPGSMFEDAAGSIYNTAPVINPDGEVVARYRKQFPFCPYERGVSSGSEFCTFDVPGVGRFGVSICYDMWFPETIRTLAWLGAEVILHPSLTSTIDREVEQAMVRAHAAQNQCYFVDCNVAGPIGVGGSCIAGPGGEVIYQAEKGREIIPLKLDLGYLREVRQCGWHNLGQPLKSFRDSEVEFPAYRGERASEALQALGPLQMPEAVGRKSND